MGYALTTALDRPFDETVEATRSALAEQGFGVLAEIDMSGTLKAKIDADVPRQLILGACNPPLAHRALQVEESIALLLPCNVVVRELGEGRTAVQAMDPDVMSELTGNPGLGEVAADAGRRLRTALASLGGTDVQAGP